MSRPRLKQTHLDASARRIVTGLDDNGRSTFVGDGPTRARFASDAYTVNQIWQAASVPTPVMAENTLGDSPSFAPPPNGYTYVVTTFPPDSSWDYEGGYAKALSDWGAGDSLDENDPPGMHTTDSIDIVTIISGEIWAIVETGETLMKPGDTLVQRGTKHAWSNRSDKDCVIAALHLSIIR
ncbi:MAG: cupin domain-containing protein [Mesorhizobium sp.]|nr:MAG: cupin domain-containing protein [Mesorhizobium sp.]